MAELIDSLLETLDATVVAIDGKTLRSSIQAELTPQRRLQPLELIFCPRTEKFRYFDKCRASALQKPEKHRYPEIDYPRSKLK